MKFENIYILDLEYLSWSLKSAKNIKFRKKSQPPEIIQLGIIKLDLEKFSKKKFLKLFVLPKINKVPLRIKKLTGITDKKLKKRGENFKISMNKTLKFINSNSLIICNGNDDQILKINFKLNNMSNLFAKKRVYFYNLNKILIKIFPKNNSTTSNLKKIFNIKNKLKPHDALNDCKIINDSIKQLLKNIGKKKFLLEISSNYNKN